MPRLVRRAPLMERIKASLTPYDLLLWAFEELNDDTLDDLLKDWAFPIGVALNIVFVLVRGASRTRDAGLADDVFGDPDGMSGRGWFTWFAAFVSHLLAVFCCFNAFFTFYRKRHYRLFEQPIDAAPPTPSAHRVRVDSSPAASSPMRFFKDLTAYASAASRSSPDAERDVWELRVWDPKPSNLAMFTWFSPGHLLLYYALLPPAPLDPRPSVTVVTALAFSAILSFQLNMLKISFTQQAKDSALVHGQVMNEYETKFVRPHLNRPVRDVAVQTRESALSPGSLRVREVDVYTPTTIINRGFRVNPNPNYVSHYDPDQPSFSSSLVNNHANGTTTTSSSSSRRDFYDNHSNLSTPKYPSTNYRNTNNHVNGSASHSHMTTASIGTDASALDFSSPLKAHHEKLHHHRSSARGVSPLRKTASSNAVRADRRDGSLTKRTHTPGGGDDSGTVEHGANGVGNQQQQPRRRETMGRLY